MPISRAKSREALELIVLSVLIERDAYGYAIIKQVRGQSDGEIRLTPGVLYPLLHELEQSKLIAARWEEVHSERKDAESDADGRRRKWYRITAKGKRRLSQRIAAHRAQQKMIESFLPAEDAAGGAA
ncbi:MAG: PadR family transcriptional regulator [Phycisphaerales bacterium]